MRRLFFMPVLMILACPLVAEEVPNLVKNGSFEEYSVSSNPLLGEQTSFEDWAFSSFGASAEKTDVVDGNAAMRVQPNTSNGTLDQQITLGEDFAEGDLFELTVHYKAVGLNGGTLSLDSYWEPRPGGDADKMKQHDADKLQQVLATEAGDAWQTLTVQTKMPANARYFRLRAVVSAKNSNVLFDAFSLTYAGHEDPENPDQPDDPKPDDPSQSEWAADFTWDDSKPLAVMEEHFDGAVHNKPLALDGWQNVAAADQRPWWGFDESTISYIEGSGKYAKATAYQYATEKTGTWEMWLVTPALDYKNAPSQVFTFRVKGEYLPEEGIEAALDVFYIDASNPKNVFFQQFDGLSIPSTADENNVWVPFEIHLEGQPNIADAFHMAFRFTGPNGSDGAVTYYIDDVTWGVQTQGIDQVPSDQVQGTKVMKDGVLYLMYKGRMYDVRGNVVK